MHPPLVPTGAAAGGQVARDVGAPDAPAGTAVVLVVDDTDGNRYATTRWLERAGFRVIEAATGAEALEVAHAEADLIVLDVHLPDIHGFEVAQRLKTDPRTAHLPVLHLSAERIATADRVLGLESGADGYLTHPVEPAELVASARALLRLGRSEQTLRERNAALQVASQAAEHARAEAERAQRAAEVAQAVAERALREAVAARQIAEAANQAKTQFLTTMSHELRTPLNAIQGYTQLLDMGLHGPVTDAQRGALARIERSQRHLLGLVNDVLNYARLGSGRLEYDVQAILVADVVTDVLPMVEPQLAAKGISVEVHLPESGPAGPTGRPPVPVWADREKLGQIFLNLLSNAVKFTPSGGRVTVELTARDDGSGPGELAYFRVVDTGIGLPREMQEAVFEPFVQVRGDHAREAGGTGLGLAISRDLARGMGGDLRVRSTPGAGSAFTVTLRRVASAAGEEVDRRVARGPRARKRRRTSDTIVEAPDRPDPATA